MTITRADVADLREGDVVEIRNDEHPGTVVGGSLTINDEGYLMLGDYEIVRRPDGDVVRNRANLIVVSRAPRPLYVNHPRTEPVPGDVVSRGDEDGATWSWCPLRSGVHRWRNTQSDEWMAAEDFARLPIRLLVDGETGQVVP